jgi:hypothetical protein
MKRQLGTIAAAGCLAATIIGGVVLIDSPSRAQDGTSPSAAGYADPDASPIPCWVVDGALVCDGTPVVVVTATATAEAPTKPTYPPADIFTVEVIPGTGSGSSN